MPEKIKKAIRNLGNHESFNLWYMCISGAVISLMNSMESPSFMKTIYAAIPQKLISIQSFCCCAASILVCMLWTKSIKVRRFVMKHYMVMALIGMVFSVAIDTTTLINVDKSWMVYILVIGNTICFDVLLGEWFSRGWSFLKAALFESTKSRNKYDTISDLCDYVSMLVGFAVGIFIDVPINVALILSIVAGFIWGLRHVVIFKVNKTRILQKVEETEEETDKE